MTYRKYSDDKLKPDPEVDGSVLDTPELRIVLGGSLAQGCARTYEPESGASAESGAQLNSLAERATGDWSWKPHRDAQLGDTFRTFYGVPLSPAESRPRGAEPGARFFGGHDEDVYDFQQRAIAAHRAAGDAQRVRAEHSHS